MELYHLKTFVAVAEEGHLTRASERLFTSQPAISAQLKALEEELGVALFDRTPKGMALTAAGERLLGDARRTLAAAGDLVQTARGLQDQLIGRVRIGLNSDADFLRLVDIQARLSERHPGLELEWLSGNTAMNVPQLRVEKLDASFISGDRQDRQLATWTLFEEDLAVAVPERLREAVADGDITTLARQPWIYATLECPYYHVMARLFEQHGCQPTKTLIADQEDAVASMVRGGIGLGILRREKVERLSADGSMFALPKPLPLVPLRFAVLARRANEPIIRAVIDEVLRAWSVEEAAERLAV